MSTISDERLREIVQDPLGALGESEITPIAAELLAAREVLAKLDKTADGALVINCEKLYCPEGHEITRFIIGAGACGECWDYENDCDRFYCEVQFFSSPEAALAAKEAKP